MRTAEEYTAMIPERPPYDMMDRLRSQGKFTTGLMSYRRLTKDQAREIARTGWWDSGGDYFGDWRESENDRAALMRCSECGREFMVEYVPGHSDTRAWGGKTPSGVRMLIDGYTGVQGHDGDDIECPECGSTCTLKSAGSLRYGLGEQVFMTVPTVTDGCLVLTVWCIDRHMYEMKTNVSVNAIEAYIVDGKKTVRMVHWRRCMGRLYNLGHWEQTKHMRDGLDNPMMYSDAANSPDLAGTSLENAKLWEYMEQSSEAEVFYPMAYARLYLKHPAVENLVTAGLGRVIGKGIQQEAQIAYYYGYVPTTTLTAPRLDWVDWKQSRPAQMLRMDKQKLRTVQQKGYGLDHIKFLQRFAKAISFADACTLLDAVGPTSAGEIVNSGQNPIKTVNYLQKQGQGFTYLADYWRMAAVAGMDLEQQEVRWPKNLGRAHDRAALCVRAAKIGNAEREAFEAMTERCAGLAWEHDGICIRPAATPEELISEGDTLHHCVGSYISNHASGRIILFVRHARRPERSWYTLNIDVKDKHQIQLHGYRNEMLPGGKMLHIPQEVLAFLAEWRRVVLNSWKLPPAPEKVNNRKSKAPAGKPAA